MIAKVFDVLGLVAPFVLIGKLIMQECWTVSGLSWDAQLPESLQVKMKNWALQLHHLKNYSVPRCLCPNSGKIWEIVTAVDASLVAMSAVVYVISAAPDGSLSSRLTYAKNKVKPKKASSAVADTDTVVAIWVSCRRGGGR